MLKNILDVCGAAVGFYTVGYALAFGDQEEHTGFTFVGTTDFFTTKNDIDYAFWFFEFCFAASSATSELLFTLLSPQTCLQGSISRCLCVLLTVVAGTIAERCLMPAYAAYSLFLSSFVYPTVAHAMWSKNGVLSPFAEEPFRGVGSIDFSGKLFEYLHRRICCKCFAQDFRHFYFDAAGSGVVHMVRSCFAFIDIFFIVYILKTVQITAGRRRYRVDRCCRNGSKNGAIL